MSKKIVLFSLAVLVGVLGGAYFASAQTGPKIALVLQTENQKTINQAVEEKVTVQNTGTKNLEAGVLEVALPAEVRFDFGDPVVSEQDFNTIYWATPTLGPGESFAVRYVLTPESAATSATTRLTYSEQGRILQTADSVSNIREQSAPAVIGAQIPAATSGETLGETLPRTGTDLLAFFTVLSVLFVVFGARSLWIKKTKSLDLSK